MWCRSLSCQDNQKFSKISSQVERGYPSRASAPSDGCDNLNGCGWGTRDWSQICAYTYEPRGFWRVFVICFSLQSVRICFSASVPSGCWYFQFIRTSSAWSLNNLNLARVFEAAFIYILSLRASCQFKGSAFSSHHLRFWSPPGSFCLKLYFLVLNALGSTLSFLSCHCLRDAVRTVSPSKVTWLVVA